MTSPNDPMGVARVVQALQRGQSFLVTSHAGPVGDAIGCTVAAMLVLQGLGKEVFAYNPDPVPRRYQFLRGAELISGSLPEQPVDTTLLLDCSDDRVFGGAQVPRDLLGTIIVVDHHLSAGDLGDIVIQDPRAASVGVILYRIYAAMDIALTREIAEALFCSILSDTGSFRYRNTNGEAMHVAASLLDHGVDPWRIASSIYEDRPRRELELLAGVLQTLQVSECGRAASLTVTCQMLATTGCSPDVADGFINYARGIEGVEVAMLFWPSPSMVRVSLRSRGTVNVAKIAETFGGGGHHNAAGCRVKDSLENVRAHLFAEVQRALDLMPEL
jgi:bifunctional oligoribonuclease and PAP phosphatase NrnA